MSLRHKIRVFIGAAKIGFKHIISEQLPLLGSFIMFAVLVVAYSGVFRWIPAEDLAAHNLTYVQMVWYIAVTEFVLFCGSFAHFKDLQHDIQTDQIHLELLRPCPVWIVRLGEWSGQYVARFSALVIPCFALTFYESGLHGLALTSILGIVASLPVAGSMLLVCNFMLGVSCLWLKQAEPAYWIWQKSLFLLGALLWPLALYPSLFGKLVWLTPFPAILAVPGGWITSSDTQNHVQGAICQMFWLVIFILLAIAANRALIRRIQSGAE